VTPQSWFIIDGTGSNQQHEKGAIFYVFIVVRNSIIHVVEIILVEIRIYYIL